MRAGSRPRLAIQIAFAAASVHEPRAASVDRGRHPPLGRRASGFGLIVSRARTTPSSRFASQAPRTKSGAMKDARGLDVSANDPAAVAAADDFAARLPRLDQGVEGILEAAKRWPDTSIIQLYAAAFWLYGQTDGARETAATHLRACEALAMNRRERALHRALALWHGNDNLYAVEALEAITAEWPGDLFTAKLAEFLYYVLGQQYMGPRFRAPSRTYTCRGSGFSRHGGLRQRAVRRLRRGRGACGTCTRHRAAKPVGAARALPRSHPPGPGAGGSGAAGIIPAIACDLRPAHPLSRCLAPCIAASRAARRRRGNARVPHAYLGHHSGFRGRATRRHRLAMAHRDGRHRHGCAMAY